MDDTEPKAKVLPLRSCRDFTAGSALMNLLVNFSSCSRCTRGIALPVFRRVCTKVKPPSQARSRRSEARDSTTAA
ncbi:hypothetical protein D3C77_721500 [compost metagenome]